MDGPVLIAANHPNSFLDAIILDILFERPVWSLARGDVFKKSFYRKLLYRLKILPVYRTSEGVENLGVNYQTFEECKKIFKANGIVLMFSEGKCINEWHLRPLKKGTARLALSSWADDIPLQVLPLGINYSSFRRFGKNIFLNFGDIILKDDIPNDISDGRKHLVFNDRLRNELEKLVFEIDANDKKKQKDILAMDMPMIVKVLLFIPALAGWLLNAPLYLPLHRFAWRKTNHNDHFDSVLNALVIFLYPLYLALITSIIYFITGSGWTWINLAIMPFCAWSYVRLKPQLDRRPVSKS